MRLRRASQSWRTQESYWQTASGEQQGVCIILPKEVKMNVLNVINIEINKQKEELKDL